jgi:hypothetical protein
MMSKLKRRISVITSADDMGSRGVDDDERRARRISAPAELPKRERDGFAHPVLALPGAFWYLYSRFIGNSTCASIVSFDCWFTYLLDTLIYLY